MSNSTRGTVMRKSVEVDKYRVLTICSCGCGKTFIPSRSAISRQLSAGLPLAFFSSNSCTAKYMSITRPDIIDRKVKAAKESLTGVSFKDHRGKQEHNLHAHFYCLKSPDSVIYTFRNLSNFVREHAELFPLGHSLEKKTGKSDSHIQTRQGLAAQGLSKLFLNGKAQRSSYLGWVAIWKKDRLGNIVWQRVEE